VSHHYVSLRVDIDGDGVSDSWEDSDGDGAFNIQELLIGKNPANSHDVLGIRLVVATDWIASDGFIGRVVEAFRKASNAIYDYTDGHAFISEIKIVCYDGRPPEFYDAHVVIYESESDFKEETGEEREHTKAPGVYWWAEPGDGIRLMKKTFTCVFCWSVAAVIAHEIGHYVFRFGDEYVYWDRETREWKELSDWEQISLQLHGIRSLMGFGWGFTAYYDEISTYDTYETLEEEGFGYIKRTDQWAMWRGEGLEYGFCWYSLVAFLTNTSRYEHTPFSMNFYLAGNALTGVDDSVLLNYKPLEGPYTLVATYMVVVFG